MKIRSVTSFVDVEPNGNISDSDLHQLELFNKEVKIVMQESQYQLQSLRCATNPFPNYLNGLPRNVAVEKVETLENILQSVGFDYISIGTATTDHLALYPLIPEIIKSTDSVFATAQMVTPDSPMISIEAIKMISSIVKSLSTQDENGFGNLFFAALAKVPGGIPFLPAAYKVKDGTGLSFALAMESADLAVTAFGGADNLIQAGEKYKDAIETAAQKLEDIVLKIGRKFGLTFLGFDFTPAPFVKPESSAGGALEILSGASIGELSSVSAAAFLMSVLDTAEFRRSGFNGLMLPVLEDSVLAQGAINGQLTLKDLLLYSTVCGTGLDTVPLPGDITEEQIQAILLDVASLAVRLNKPLTARLMPIPGKKAGEMTSFDFPFFTNSRVMDPEGSGVSGLFSSANSLSLRPRTN